MQVQRQDCHNFKFEYVYNVLVGKTVLHGFIDIKFLF